MYKQSGRIVAKLGAYWLIDSFYWNYLFEYCEQYWLYNSSIKVKYEIIDQMIIKIIENNNEEMKNERSV